MTKAPRQLLSWRTVQRRAIVRTVIGTARAKHMPKAHLKLASHRKSNSHAPTASERRPANPRAPDGSGGRTAHGRARKNRWGHRDATMVLVAYRHGFRPAELVDLRWDQVTTPHCFPRSADSIRHFDQSASRQRVLGSSWEARAWLSGWVAPLPENAPGGLRFSSSGTSCTKPCSSTKTWA
jgi:integrase